MDAAERCRLRSTECRRLAERCRLQSIECHRLMELARSEVEVKALRNLVRSWTLIANQTDQYAEIIQKLLTDEGIAEAQEMRG